MSPRSARKDRRRRLCYVCAAKPARKLKARWPYKYAVKEATFCSIRCAADFGLLNAGIGREGVPVWCRRHGWQSVSEGEASCDECLVEEYDAAEGET